MAHMTCPHCTNTMDFPGNLAGKRIRCGQCKAEFDAPSKEEFRQLQKKDDAETATLLDWFLWIFSLAGGGICLFASATGEQVSAGFAGIAFWLGAGLIRLRILLRSKS